MSPAKKKVKEFLSLHDGPHALHSQIIIDIIEDLLNQFFGERDLENDPITRDEVGAVNYNLGNLHEIFNPELKNDIDFIEQAIICFDEWKQEIEFTNGALGIPKEEG